MCTSVPFSQGFGPPVDFSFATNLTPVSVSLSGVVLLPPASQQQLLNYYSLTHATTITKLLYSLTYTTSY